MFLPTNNGSARESRPGKDLVMIFSSLRRLALAGIAACALGVATVPAQAQSLSAEQRAAVVELIKETLLKNPELIQEALVELEKRNQVAQVEAQRNALAAEKASLTDPRDLGDRRQPAGRRHPGRVHGLQLRLLQKGDGGCPRPR
jgi:hypothetical protein